MEGNRCEAFKRAETVYSKGFRQTIITSQGHGSKRFDWPSCALYDGRTNVKSFFEIATDCINIFFPES
jgi:hypothetical protein